MKNKILKLVEDKPKHYSKLVKNDPDMLSWVLSNTQILSDHLPSNIYSAIHQVSNVCSRGNVKPFDRASTGFTGCGPANICACTAENISKKVALTKQALTATSKQATNLKRNNTMLKKYGVAYNSQRGEVKQILSKPKIALPIHEKLIDATWLDEEYNVKKRSLSEIADELGIYYSTVGEYCRKLGFDIRLTALRSVEESQICDYIRSLNVDVVESDRSVISPKELDIYIPSKKFAIEVNGLYWHSHNPSSGKPENRMQHASKSQQAKKAGVDVMHITDFEWHEKQPIIKALVKAKLGLNSKIAARKCEIRHVNHANARSFLETYHLQGYVASTFAIGLYFQNALQMIITLGKSRFKKEFDLELLRMCSVSGITVVGGISKLIAEIKRLIPSSSIVSYCDLSKGTGIGYQNAGFTLVGSSGPGYFWTNGTTTVSRYRCQKKQLAKWLPGYDSDDSEAQNLFNSGYRRYWDCGNAIYSLAW